MNDAKTPTEGIDAFDAATPAPLDNVTRIRPTVGRTVLYYFGGDPVPVPAMVVGVMDEGPHTVPEIIAYVHYTDSANNGNISGDLYDAGQGPPDICRFEWMPYQMTAAK